MEERFVVWHTVIDKTRVSSSMRQIKIYIMPAQAKLKLVKHSESCALTAAVTALI